MIPNIEKNVSTNNVLPSTIESSKPITIAKEEPYKGRNEEAKDSLKPLNQNS